jgi:hypothetical protein
LTKKNLGRSFPIFGGQPFHDWILQWVWVRLREENTAEWGNNRDTPWIDSTMNLQSSGKLNVRTSWATQGRIGGHRNVQTFLDILEL